MYTKTERINNYDVARKFQH